MLKIKLLNPDMTSYGGFKWEIGKKYTIEREGSELCTNQVFHFYDSPEMAVIMNPIHAHIQNPLAFECECDQVAHDGIKGGAKSMMLLRPVTLPTITIEQQVTLAILCAKQVYSDPKWTTWADRWLSGVDRSAAAAAARAAAAAETAAWAAAETAAWAADAAAAAADAAAWAADAAAAAAETAAWAAAEEQTIDFTSLLKEAGIL